jgi:hypothetical protein
MTEIDSISISSGKKTQDSVQCPEYLLLFNMIIGNTFFINRFPNTINAIRTTVQYTGYRWASFNSFVLLILCSPTHTSLFQAQSLQDSYRIKPTALASYRITHHAYMNSFQTADLCATSFDAHV